MNSLVDYEDSDPEEQSEKDKITVSPQANPRCQIPNPITDPLSLNLQNDVVSSLWSRTRSWKSTRVTNPLVQNRVGVSALKKSEAATSGVRPYVSKRQRVAPPGGGDSLDASEENLAGERPAPSRLLTEVSEVVRPHLGHHGGRAELPRRRQLRVQAHQGPVNTIQWCPVPHLSHLLLSASMDKSAKVWEGVESGRCLRTFTGHSGAVRDTCWSPCGRHVLTGSFDNTAKLTDVETGKEIISVGNQFKVCCIAIHPNDPDTFLCGGYSPEVKAWDSRTCKAVRVYRGSIQQTLDILFLTGGREFVTSTDSVSRDSAERTLIAWDFQTTAKVSNQIFHEKYTCPSLALHPQEDLFVAQTNGNYIAIFSTQRPYRMNKRRRYEGHKVEGYAVQCQFSRDGSILASGSSTGSAHFYEHQSSRALHTLRAHQQTCVSVALHPVLPAVAATCDWGGELCVWS